MSSKRDNFGQFQKRATIHIKKELNEIAKKFERDVAKIVQEKLYETYTTNVTLSYEPRSQQGKDVLAYNKEMRGTHKKKLTYRHTGTFESSIYVANEDNVLKVKILDLPYTTDDRTEGGSTVDVYEYLTKGTPGGGYYFHGAEESKIGGKNYPTPVHPFEEQTMEQMKGFLDSLGEDIKNGEYSGRRYYKKWR